MQDSHPLESTPLGTSAALVDFEDFCACLCGLMGVDTPDLQPDPNGLVGFTVDYHETTISFMKGERADQEAVLMMVDFGSPPVEKEAEVMRSLADANFLMTGIGAPAFARNPATGEISLHQSFLISQVDVQSIYQRIANAADTVATWRKNNFLDAPLPYAAL